MSGFSWIILNILLAVLAIGGTVAYRKRPVPPPLKLASVQPLQKSGRTVAASAAVQNASPRSNSDKVSVRKENLDELWSKTLFLPTREEAPDAVADGSGDSSSSAVANQNVDFELIGIAQITEGGAEALPIAVLRRKNSSSRTATVRRFVNGRWITENVQPAGAKSNGKFAAQAPKEVFKVGDKINDTGYAVSAIDVEKHEVELSRGSYTVKLTINFSNPEAVKRRESAVQTAVKAKQQAIQADAARIKELLDARARMQNGGKTTLPGPPGSAANTQRGAVVGNSQNQSSAANNAAAIRQRLLQERLRRSTTPAPTTPATVK